MTHDVKNKGAAFKNFIARALIEENYVLGDEPGDFNKNLRYDYFIKSGPNDYFITPCYVEVKYSNNYEMIRKYV